MEEERRTLCAQLELIDTDLGFLLLIITGVLLSYLAAVRQRDALCLTLQGQTEAAVRVGDVYSLRLGASALIVGSLGFFFMQGLETCREADPADPAAARSARLNLIAGFLVLLAALIRLFDLNAVRRAQPALADDLPPDQFFS